MSPQDLRLSSPNEETTKNPTQVGKPTGVENPVRRLTEQDSSVEMESRASDGLTRGYTRIPNQILMQLAGGDFTRNEIRIALLIARFTISFRRDFAPLSKKVLERQSGLRGAAVLEAVAGLVEKGLVRKKKGDQYRPNMLSLVLPADWQNVTGPSEKSEEVLPVLTPVETTTSPVVEKATEGEVGNSTHFKDIKIYKITLSSLPDVLKSYFEDLKPVGKRESEWKAFVNLSRDFDTQEIGECLELLVRRGIRFGKSGGFQHCHSPMAYLTKAMNQVLLEVRSKKKPSSPPIVTQSPFHERDEEWKTQQAQEFSRMEQEFTSAYPTPDRQEAIIQELCQETFRSSPAIRRLYALRIWSKREKNRAPHTVAHKHN